MRPDAIGSYPVHCVGVSSEELAPLKDMPVEASITGYKDGSRDIGCPFLNDNDGTCQAGAKHGSETHAHCIHLFPTTSLARPQDSLRHASEIPSHKEQSAAKTTQREENVEAMSAALRRNIRSLRGGLGLSQQGLAERAGVHANTVKEIENLGTESNPRLKTIESLARALGTTALDLLS